MPRAARPDDDHHTLPPGSSGTPIPATLVLVRPGRVAKMVASGVAPLAAGVDPRMSGGTLSIRGATGAATYALPASGWKPVGRRRPKGFKFSGSPCQVSFVKRRITPVCKGDTGTLALPEAGPVSVALESCTGAAFCAECGGRAVGVVARVQAQALSGAARVRLAIRRRRAVAVAAHPRAGLLRRRSCSST